MIPTDAGRREILIEHKGGFAALLDVQSVAADLERMT